MSGIYIKGMKMPNGCHLCPFANEYDECCINAFLEDQHEITHYCHLIPIPDHGDLIDRDALKEKAHKLPNGYNHGYFHKCVDELFDYAPVVIPAERSEE